MKRSNGAAAARRADDRQRNADREAPMISASSISSIDTGSRSATACSTVCPVRNERPKSPCRTLPSQLQIAPPDRLIEPHVARAAPRRSPASPGHRGSCRRDRPAAATRSRTSAAIPRSAPAPDTGAGARRRTQHGRLFQPGARYVDHPAVHLRQALHLGARDRVVGVLEGPEPDRLLVDQPADRAIVLDALVLDRR